jgi:surface polysaccharide O-acyltransferase-like enzyme
MLAWVLGATAVGLAAAWWLTEVVGLRLRWLVVLGRTALALYVVHHLLVVTLVQRALGVRLTGWAEFWGATAALVAVLVVVGMAWLALRSAAARERRRWRAPATPRPVAP